MMMRTAVDLPRQARDEQEQNRFECVKRKRVLVSFCVGGYGSWSDGGTR
jgi:hypothetical protein